jgi:hypothetical protein
MQTTSDRRRPFIDAVISLREPDNARFGAAGRNHQLSDQFSPIRRARQR